MPFKTLKDTANDAAFLSYFENPAISLELAFPAASSDELLSVEAAWMSEAKPSLVVQKEICETVDKIPSIQSNLQPLEKLVL